jgi:O-glycosyl hydrolase
MRHPITPPRIAYTLSAALPLLVAAACSSSETPAGTGGTTSSSSSGSPGSSGSSASGGSPTSGGSPAAGGSPTTGGTQTSGGNVSGGATGSSGSSTAGGTGATSGGSGGSPSVDGIAVKLDAGHQNIVGFGINSALMPSDKNLPIDDLFGTTGQNGIGLSILRIGMKPDGSLTGKYVSEAKAKGAKIIGSCWSPPASCKTNKNTEQGGHLVSDDGGTCYNSWATTIANFAKQQGLYAMSIANESDFASCKSKGPPCTDDYDSTVYTGKEMAAWVKVAGAKLKDAGVKVIAPEASEWIHAWSNLSATGSTVSSHPQSSDPLGCGCFSNTISPEEEAKCPQTCKDGAGYDYGHWMAKDQAAWDAFDIFGVHEYDSQIAFAWPKDVNNGVRNKEIWQTEMSGVKYWPEEGPSTDINNGLAVAGWIHSALTVGEASAWLWWWYESYYQNDNEGLGIIQGSSTVAKRYYALGQYSKFVRPGFTAVEVVGNANASVLLSGYKGMAGEVVVVAINKGDAEVTLPITITGGTAPAMLTPTVTSAMDSLKDGTAVPVTSGAFMAKLAAKSITTFSGK